MIVDELRPALLAVFCGHGVELLAEEIAQLPFAGQQRVELGDLALKRLGLLQAVQEKFLVDVAQLDLGDVLGLNLVDAEADHEVRHDLGVLLGLADDGDGLVDIEQNPAQTLEQVQLVQLLLPLEVYAAADTFGAPRRPLGEDLAHAHHARHARDENVEVAAE